MKYINKLFKDINIIKYSLVFFISLLIVGGCTEDAEKFQSSNPVNTAIVSITPDTLLGNACTIGDIVVDAELIPDGSGFSIEILENESSVDGCIIGADFTVENKVATASFLADYVLGGVGSIRVLIRITPVDGAPFQTFEDIIIAGISLTAPSPEMGDNFVVEVDPMGDPPDPISLIFSSVGLGGKTSEAEIILSDGALGSIDDDTPPILGDGSIIVVYSPNNTPGVQAVTATVTLTTDPDLIALCPLLSGGAILSATVIVEQVTAEDMGP